MICKVADLFVEVPAAGGLASRCEGYLCDQEVGADIIVRADLYRADKYPYLSECALAYMESGFQFCTQLVYFSGFHLHASAVVINGRAFLFAGPCGVGKSTHARFWQQIFGDKAKVINDDKPALRRLDDRWYAYGTPWCGKDGINENTKASVTGVCFLKQSFSNRIRRLESKEAVAKILAQSARRFDDLHMLDLMISHVDRFVREVPIYELENRPEPEAAMLSYETMLRGAEDAGL